MDVTLETSPTPLSMLTVVAPETLHDNIAACPAVIAAGAAANQFMLGAEGPVGFAPTCICPLAGVKSLADAVMIADPIAMPFSAGARLGVVAPCGMKMFTGTTVTLEESLLVSVMKTPLAGAAVVNFTGKDAESPGATVTFAGTMI